MSYFRIHGYFFIIKKNLIFQDNFTSEFSDDRIVVTCFDNKEEAKQFRNLLKSEGFNESKDYVEGTCRKDKKLTFSANSWLNFRKMDGNCAVSHL